MPSKMTRVNIILFSIIPFALVIVVLCGTTLLATDLLYSEALIFSSWAKLLLFLTIAAALSALFLEAEEPTVKVLGRCGLDRVWSETLFALIHGLATALLLTLVARLVPGVELKTSAALAAGLIGAFGFYFTELIFVHSGSTDTEEMTLMESSLEDEED